MKNKNWGVDREHWNSYLEKLVFSWWHFLIILIWVYIIFFSQIELIDKNRAIILLLVAILYFIRHIITLFYLFVRKIEFWEVFWLLSFFLIFEIWAILVWWGFFSNKIIEFWNLDIFAILLLIFGSFLNTYSELQRKIWKKDSKNKWHLFIWWLFKHSMHINFFWDVVLFTGWMLLTHYFLMLILPIFMFIAFTFFHIPNLDKYLLWRYWKEFEEYFAKTKKLIPFIY